MPFARLLRALWVLSQRVTLGGVVPSGVAWSQSIPTESPRHPALCPPQRLPAAPASSPQPCHGHGLTAYAAPPAPVHLCSPGPCAWHSAGCGTRLGGGLRPPGTARVGAGGSGWDPTGYRGLRGAGDGGWLLGGWVSLPHGRVGLGVGAMPEPLFHPTGLAPRGSPPPAGWQPLDSPPFALLPARAPLHPAASLVPGAPLSPPVPPLHASSPEPLARLSAPGGPWL